MEGDAGAMREVSCRGASGRSTGYASDQASLRRSCMHADGLQAVAAMVIHKQLAGCNGCTMYSSRCLYLAVHGIRLSSGYTYYAVLRLGFKLLRLHRWLSSFQADPWTEVQPYAGVHAYFKRPAHRGHCIEHGCLER